MGRARLDPTKGAAKWESKVAGAGEAYKAGIEGVQNNPMEAAAANKAGYVRGVQRAADEGKWEAGLMRTSFATWKQIAKDKGANRLRDGAATGKAKYLQFAQTFYQYAQQVSDTVRAMPKVTEADGDARALKAIQMLRKYKRA